LTPLDAGFMIAGVGFVAGGFIATATLPVTWPTGVLFAMILRWIDPPTPASAGQEQQIVSDHRAAPANGGPCAPSP